MKRKLTIMSFLSMFIFILTSCTVNQNSLKDDRNSIALQISNPAISRLNPTVTEKKILFFDNQNNNIEAKTQDGKLPDLVGLTNNVSSNREFAKIYLQERGINKKIPDGGAYYNGNNIAEYYMDKSKSKICFVVHLLDRLPTETIFCITLDIADTKKIGSINYSSDEKKGTAYESLYDINGKEAAHISYQYKSGLPFPIITEYTDENNYKDTFSDVFFRNQKFWLFEKTAEFDKSGRLIAYDGDIYHETDINNHYICSYDKSGNINKIDGTLSQSDIKKYFGDYSSLKNSDKGQSKVKISYQKNGFPDTISYQRSSNIYGTTSSSGEIYYDTNGRIIYEDSYITHGNVYKFYIYNGREKTPWIYIYLDLLPNSESEMNGIKYVYGDYFSIYLFQVS